MITYYGLICISLKIEGKRSDHGKMLNEVQGHRDVYRFHPTFSKISNAF